MGQPRRRKEAQHVGLAKTTGETRLKSCNDRALLARHRFGGALSEVQILAEKAGGYAGRLR